MDDDKTEPKSQVSEAAYAQKFEFVKLELNVRLEEFKALRAEIVSLLSSAYLTTNLTITGSGILIAATPIIIIHQMNYLFILASLLFYMISLTQLRYLQNVHNMSCYISLVVAPGIRKFAAKLQIQNELTMDDCVLNWEGGGKKLIHPSNMLLYPMEAARFIIPVAVGAVSGLGFVLSHVSIGSLSRLEWTAVAINMCALLYTLVATYLLRIHLAQGCDKFSIS